MPRIAVRYTFTTFVAAALVCFFASGPVLASGAILVVTAADGPMPKTASGAKQTNSLPGPSYAVTVEAPTMIQNKKKGR